MKTHGVTDFVERTIQAAKFNTERMFPGPETTVLGDKLSYTNP